MVENNGYLRRRILMISLLLTLSAGAAFAQTTSFTYQGRLTDGGTATNGNYDLQFALFDSAQGVAQIATQTIPNVAVSAGIFTVQLDFGATAFPGANRFLEISARLTGTPTFTTLAPRQQITSTPYAIRSLNASSADAVTVNGVPGGSGNYIQNATTPQANANFNIGGNGTAGGTLSADTVNAVTQYNIGGRRVLVIPGGGNVFAGENAGNANINGQGNSFFGSGAGSASTGNFNTFVGHSTGASNMSSYNSFFGDSAGTQNTEGLGNTFVGYSAGSSNRLGHRNAFFGVNAGDRGGTGNTIGSDNTIIGGNANTGQNNLTNATAIGAFAQVDQSNALVLGSIAGVNNAPAAVNVGIGTTTPSAALSVVKAGAPEPIVLSVPTAVKVATLTGTVPLALRQNANESAGPTLAWFETADGGLGYVGAAASTFLVGAATGKALALKVNGSTTGLIIDTSGNVGIGTTSPGERLTVKAPTSGLGFPAFAVRDSNGSEKFSVTDNGGVHVPTLALGPTANHVCRNTGYLSPCSSAAEYVPTVESAVGYPEAGDLVSIAGVNPYGDEHAPFAVGKSTQACDKNLVGFLLKPELGADGKKLNEHYLPLAIYGYFSAKVTMENGAIKRGDPLTSSSKPGYGMKATQACKIVGYALEDADQEGRIQVFTHLSEYTAPQVAALQAQVEQLRRENAAREARLAALERAVQGSSGDNSFPAPERSVSRASSFDGTPTPTAAVRPKARLARSVVRSGARREQ